MGKLIESQGSGSRVYGEAKWALPDGMPVGREDNFKRREQRVYEGRHPGHFVIQYGVGWERHW